MDSYFTDKKAIVTGAGKGIGRGIAVRLCDLGAQVVAISRTQADLDSLKGEFPAIRTITLDILDWETTRKAVEEIGHVDLLVNNAGVPGFATPFLNTSREDLRNVFGVNFDAAFNISQVVAQGMVSRNSGGAIVNVSSVSGKLPICCVTYSTSKAAMDMLTMRMAKELGPYQIRTNSVNPGWVVTNMSRDHLLQSGNLEREISKTPLGHIGDVKDIVDTVVYLLSDKASMVNGQRITVDGGANIS